jgi:chemotaxis signal transduction protein
VSWGYFMPDEYFNITGRIILKGRCLKSRSLALPYTASSGRAIVQCLIFSAGEQMLAIPARSVQEIVLARPTYRMAGAPEHMAAFFSLREELVMLFDLSRALNLPNYDFCAFVVIRDGAHRLALPVSNAHDLADVELPAERMPSELTWLKWAKTQDTAVAWIDPKALLESCFGPTC